MARTVRTHTRCSTKCRPAPTPSSCLSPATLCVLPSLLLVLVALLLISDLGWSVSMACDRLAISYVEHRAVGSGHLSSWRIGDHHPEQSFTPVAVLLILRHAKSNRLPFEWPAASFSRVWNCPASGGLYDLDWNRLFSSHVLRHRNSQHTLAMGLAGAGV